MNFELKPVGLALAADEKCDVLVVLVPPHFKAGKDDLSGLIAQALKSADLEPKPGKLLSLYRPLQANAVRVILAGVGEGGAKQVRTAVLAAVGAAKAGALKKLVLCFAAPAKEEAVRAAVLAIADAS